MAAEPGNQALTLAGALPAALCARWLAATAHGDARSRPLLALAGIQSAELLHAVAGSALRLAIEAALGLSPQCNLSQCWLRHGRPPHQWHQDGALNFDFLAHAGRPLPDGAMLEMLTCWIALTPCGEHAPGLEWVAAPLSRLLTPAELTDAAVNARYAGARLVRPRLQAGDALLFNGALLHRTHLSAAMTMPRSSLELRFFRAGPVPARLVGDDFAALG